MDRGETMRGSRVRFEPLEARRQFDAAPPDHGVLATYRDNVDFTGSTVQRYETRPSLSASASPAEGISADSYSVRWTGKLRAPSTAVYRFYLTTEAAVRLTIRGEKVIDDQNLQGGVRTLRGSLKFTAGKRYEIVAEYRHDEGVSAQFALRWQTDAMAKGSIPGKWFTPAAAIPSLSDAAELSSRMNALRLFADKQLKRTLADLPSPASGIPIRSNPDGTWYTGDASNWTSGYFAGSMWQLNRKSPGTYTTLATQWTLPLASQATTRTGDFFSSVWITFKPLYDATGKKAYRLVLQQAADAKLAQFDETVGAFETPGDASKVDPSADFPVLMDQTMDLELMLWATESSGNSIYRQRAEQHLATVIANMVRPDGNVFQRGFFHRDTGTFENGQNYQGYSDTSTWSRAQAWAIHSFSVLAKATGRPDFLNAAKRVADYWFAHVKPDGVPLWDFAAPANLPYRDSSAAAIAASGLKTLGDLTGIQTYQQQAAKTMSSLLSASYLTSGSFSKSRGLLDHGADNVPKNRGVDTAVAYGDYYLLEALNQF